MKVKALIISTVEFSQNGISAVIMNYFRGMKNQNILFDLFIPSDIVVDSRTKEIEQAGGTVYSYPRKKNPIGYWFYLRNLIQNNHYDIVHVHGNSATMDIELSAAKAAGTNVRIAHCHNTSTNHPVVHRLLRKKAMADATAYFACSNAAGKWFFEDKKFTVITNGIDTEKYRFNEESRKQIRKNSVSLTKTS